MFPIENDPSFRTYMVEYYTGGWTLFVFKASIVIFLLAQVSMSSLMAKLSFSVAQQLR